MGVQGDNRSYKSLATLYPTDEGATVHNADWKLIFEIAKEIPNKFSFINRVAYCVYSDTKSIDDISCAGMHICHETADILREIDAAVTSNVMNPKIAQCFAVMFPMSANKDKKYSCAIRAVCTSDFMTARSAAPGKEFTTDALESAVKGILETEGDNISMIFYDVTGKPPATVEWE